MKILSQKSQKLLLLIILITIPLSVFAAKSDEKTIDWFLVITGLVGGLALFLYGMEKMSNGMKKSAGNRMRKILAMLSNNRFIGLAVGAFVTMIIQSSSATTVMLVSFVRSGLMTFSQTLGIILGANIGTTFTAQLIAFKLTDYAILMIALGFILSFLIKKDAIKNIGNTILGFGLLFFGMKLMSDAMYPLRSFEPFIDLLQHLENPVISILIGAAFTALVQSSSAFTGIIIVLAQQELISLQAGIPMIIGANIGTCITAGLASIGTNRESKRVAIAHSFFNIGGALLFVFWIPYFADLIKMISSYTGAGTAREIANAHTVFNIVTALFFIPLTALIAKLVIKIFPDKKQEDNDIKAELKHLDNKALSNPLIALDLARAEIKTTIKLINRMLEDIIIPIKQNEIPKDRHYTNMTLPEGTKIREKKIDYLEDKVTKYLVKIAKNELTQKQTTEVFGLISVVNYIETIGDRINNEIIPLILKKEELGFVFSDEGVKELTEYHIKISKQISRLEYYFANRNVEQAQKIIQKWEKYTKMDSEWRTLHYQRMSNDKNAIETHRMHMELMDYFLQIGFLIENIAKVLTKNSPKKL